MGQGFLGGHANHAVAVFNWTGERLELRATFGAHLLHAGEHEVVNAARSDLFGFECLDEFWVDRHAVLGPELCATLAHAAPVIDVLEVLGRVGSGLDFLDKIDVIRTPIRKLSARDRFGRKFLHR